MKFWHFCPHMGKKVFSAPTQTKFEYLLFFKVHQIKIAQICLLPCLTRPANTHKCTRKSGNFLESQAILLQNPHQSTLFLFLVVLALLFFLSYHSFFFQHGCLFLIFFFLLVLVWGASQCGCSRLLFHLDFSSLFLFLVCLVDQLCRSLIFFWWELLKLLMPKGGFSCGKNGKKKRVKQRDAGVCSIKSEMR